MKKFAKRYIETGNATQAVIDAGYNVTTKETAGAIGYENLKKPQVWAMIENYAPKAQTNIEQLAENAQNEGVRLSANKDILDRSGYLPVSKSITTTVNITIDDSRFNEILKAFNSKSSNKE